MLTYNEIIQQEEQGLNDSQLDYSCQMKGCYYDGMPNLEHAFDKNADEHIQSSTDSRQLDVKGSSPERIIQSCMNLTALLAFL